MCLWQDEIVIDQFNQYLRRTSSTANSFLLLVPWLIFYNVGLLISEFQAMSGVDPVTRALFNFGGKPLFLGLNFLLILAAFLVWRKGRKGTQPLTPVDPITISAEAAIYSSIVSVTVLQVLAEVPYLSTGLDPDGTLSKLVLASGAGLYEEILFRAILISLLIVFLETIGTKTAWLTIFLAVLISSVLFALAHYVGAESFHWYTFLYRTCAGVLFAVLYMVRGIAVAVYTHIFYDMFVFLA